MPLVPHSALFSGTLCFITVVDRSRMSFHPRVRRRKGAAAQNEDFEQMLVEQEEFQKKVASGELEPAAIKIREPKIIRAEREAREAAERAEMAGEGVEPAIRRSGHPLGVSTADSASGIANLDTTKDGRDVVSLGSAELPTSHEKDDIESTLRKQEAQQPKLSRFKQRKAAAKAAAAALEPKKDEKDGFNLLNAHEVLSYTMQSPHAREFTVAPTFRDLSFPLFAHRRSVMRLECASVSAVRLKRDLSRHRLSR